MSEHDPRHGALLRRWGAFVARHARTVLVAWLLLIVTGFAVALGAVGTPSLFDRLDSGEIVVDGENQQGRVLLAEGGGSGFEHGARGLLVSGERRSAARGWAPDLQAPGRFGESRRACRVEARASRPGVAAMAVLSLSTFQKFLKML